MVFCRTLGISVSLNSFMVVGSLRNFPFLLFLNLDIVRLTSLQYLHKFVKYISFPNCKKMLENKLLC
jgi:hypothetical protein